MSEEKMLEVDFLDVGQGDSIFIKTPEGHQIIIDGGPNSILLQKLAERMPFWDKTIDLVILTHPEKDHMTGLLDVLQNYKVDYFLWTGVIKNSAENKKLAALLEEAQKPKRNFLASLDGKSKSTKILIAKAGEKIMAGEVLIDILFPHENLNNQEPKNTNDTSVVSQLIFGNNEFLFTGDISSSAEKKLVNGGADLSASVLKVAHHGSKYSTSDIFLETVKPGIAVISVGKNSYGHPTQETLKRLEEFAIKILRTDTNGDVNMVSDGKNIILK